MIRDQTPAAPWGEGVGTGAAIPALAFLGRRGRPAGAALAGASPQVGKSTRLKASFSRFPSRIPPLASFATASRPLAPRCPRLQRPPRPLGLCSPLGPDAQVPPSRPRSPALAAAPAWAWGARGARGGHGEPGARGGGGPRGSAPGLCTRAHPRAPRPRGHGQLCSPARPPAGPRRGLARVAPFSFSQSFPA